jgi:hypothetical protein
VAGISEHPFLDVGENPKPRVHEDRDDLRLALHHRAKTVSRRVELLV